MSQSDEISADKRQLSEAQNGSGPADRAVPERSQSTPLSDTDAGPVMDHAQRLLVQDASRRADVEFKQQQIADLIERTKAEAVLLQDPANIAWFTAGADLYRCTTDNSRTSIFITPEARLFATNAVDSAQIFEREAFGLGFQLKQREWFQPHQQLIEDLCRGRRVLTDLPGPDAVAATEQIAKLRQPLTELDVRRLRILGRVVTHAVEATAVRVRRGVKESEIAGEVAHRLMKRTVTPIRVQVCADGRNQRFRHWMYGEDPVKNYVVISCMARRWGLHAGVSRIVCFETVPEELIDTFGKVVLMHATGQFFSRDGEKLGDIWKKVHRIYEKVGLASEWQRADQADVIGFTAGEHQVCPESTVELKAPTAVYWHPSVGPAACGDTVLIRDNSAQLITSRNAWPMVTVQVKGHQVACPGLMRVPAGTRPSTSEPPAAPSETLPGPASNFDDEPETRLESVWELDLATNSSVFEDDESAWSDESVFE